MRISGKTSPGVSAKHGNAAHNINNEATRLTTIFLIIRTSFSRPVTETAQQFYTRRTRPPPGQKPRSNFNQINPAAARPEKRKAVIKR
jgi:hypothetical protein